MQRGHKLHSKVGLMLQIVISSTLCFAYYLSVCKNVLVQDCLCDGPQAEKGAEFGSSLCQAGHVKDGVVTKKHRDLPIKAWRNRRRHCLMGKATLAIGPTRCRALRGGAWCR